MWIKRTRGKSHSGGSKNVELSDRRCRKCETCLYPNCRTCRWGLDDDGCPRDTCMMYPIVNPDESYRGETDCPYYEPEETRKEGQAGTRDVR